MLKVDCHDLESYLLSARKTLPFAILDEIKDFVFIKDLESRFLYNNRAHRRHLGRSQDELMGKNDFDLFPEDLARQFFADETRLIETGNPLIKVQPSLNSRGEPFIALAIKVAIYNMEGDKIGLYGIVRRISSVDPAALREARAFVREILDRELDPTVTHTQRMALESQLFSLLRVAEDKHLAVTAT